MSRDFYDASNFVPLKAIGYLVKRVDRLGTARVEAALADRELTFSQWVALSLIRFELVDNCAKLSRSLGHDSGATTRMVDQLEQRSFVSRVRDNTDRRVVKLCITEEGRQAINVLTPRVMKQWNTVLANFDHVEVELLIGLLGKLVATLEAQQEAEA